MTSGMLNRPSLEATCVQVRLAEGGARGQPAELAAGLGVPVLFVKVLNRKNLLRVPWLL